MGQGIRASGSKVRVLGSVRLGSRIQGSESEVYESGFEFQISFIASWRFVMAEGVQNDMFSTSWVPVFCPRAALNPQNESYKDCHSCRIYRCLGSMLV